MRADARTKTDVRNTAPGNLEDSNWDNGIPVTACPGVFSGMGQRSHAATEEFRREERVLAWLIGHQ